MRGRRSSRLRWDVVELNHTKQSERIVIYHIVIHNIGIGRQFWNGKWIRQLGLRRIVIGRQW